MSVDPKILLENKEKPLINFGMFYLSMKVV